MPIAKIDNIDCYYEVHGKGKPLMLIAGLASDSQSWDPVLDGLSKDFQVIVFDNRGSGRTKSTDGEFDIAQMADDAVKLLDTLGIEKANIVGHSMGGYIAQEVAISYPERVNKLILECTAAFTSDRNKCLFEDLVKLLENNAGNELFWREFMVWLFTPEFLADSNNVDTFIKDILDYPYAQSDDDFKKQVKACSEFNCYDRLDRIQIETLVVVAEKDILIPPSESEQMAGKIQNAKIKYIQNTAHSLHLEAPENLITAIKEMVEGK